MGIEMYEPASAPSLTYPEAARIMREAVRERENVMRGEGVCARNARKTHCKHGHELSPENIYWRPNGRRECATCKTIRNRNRNRPKKGDR